MGTQRVPSSAWVSFLPDARARLLFLVCSVAQAFKQLWNVVRILGKQEGVFFLPEDLGCQTRCELVNALTTALQL